MKLQKQIAYKYKGKTNYKFTIMVPQKDIKQLGWDKGIELEGTIVKDKGYFITTKIH
jgi:bifunctional DNA-binding transcriptional regulator/antitoxin component of YhaV-PrlF toxin-antitoxin module